jgi:hypothetical protein
MTDAEWLKWSFGGAVGVIVLVLARLWDRSTKVEDKAEAQGHQLRGEIAAAKEAALDADSILHKRVTDLQLICVTKADLTEAEGRIERSLARHEDQDRLRHKEIMALVNRTRGDLGSD